MVRREDGDGSSSFAELLSPTEEDQNEPGRLCRTQLLWICGPPLAGACLGLALPVSSSDDPPPFSRISSVLGWSYFAAWSVSFYPQVVQNFSRRSVVGLSLDYQILNFLGFLCYFSFNGALYWSSYIQSEYKDAHHGQSSAVRLNDVWFAGHAMVLTAVTLLQIAVYYDYPPLKGSERMLRIAVICFVSGVVVCAGGLLAAIVAFQESFMTWLTYLGTLAQVKVFISVVKYMPQVWMNCRRQSTDGWAIENVLLDFMGGALSVGQLVLDGFSTSDWSAVTGDPAKFLLGNCSMVFDVIFMAQHYCLYPMAHRR